MTSKRPTTTRENARRNRENAHGPTTGGARMAYAAAPAPKRRLAGLSARLAQGYALLTFRGAMTSEELRASLRATPGVVAGLIHGLDQLKLVRRVTA